METEATALTAARWPTETIISEIRAAYESQWDLKEFWLDEEPGVRAAIDALGEALPKYSEAPRTDRYAYVRVLGVGGSGIVLRLRDQVFPKLDNALKFPRPVAGKVSLILEMLKKEIEFLAELRHPGIVRILYHAEITGVAVYGRLPFYLMEAIDGTRSDQFVRNQSITPAKGTGDFAAPDMEMTLTRLFIDVLDAVRYLHRHPSGPRVHLDIKPENIVVTETGQPVLIDLGTCKKIARDSDLTIVACTYSMAAPSLGRKLRQEPSDENRAGGEIPREEILLSWDLWAYAASLLRWLGIDQTNGQTKSQAIANLLSPYARKYLLLLSARLMANESLVDMPSWLADRIGLAKTLLRSMAITTSDEAIELLERLRGSSNPLSALPELAARAVTTIQPSEGLHVPLTPKLSHLLKHRSLRRLDSIAQLGMVVEVYPEARHTRKEHSVGTYAWVVQYLHALYSDPVSPLFKQWITARDCTDVLLAAILHDIGHFPLAHDLEDIDRNLFDHEDLTAAWLRGSFKRKLVFESLDDILSEWGTTAERILAILSAKASSLGMAVEPKAKLLRSLISGPIDADKIDYLSRDAERMHLPYPRGIDIDRILKSLTTVVIDRVSSGAKDVPVIGVHAKGKIAAEFVSIARYAMFSQGYWHHAVRSMKAMLARAVRALTAEATDDSRNQLQLQFMEFVFSLPEAIFDSGVVQPNLFQAPPTSDPKRRLRAKSATEVPQLAVTDVATLRWLEDRLRRENRPEAELVSGILSRSLYKRLWVVSRDMQHPRWDAIVKLWSSLSRSKKHQVVSILERLVSNKLNEHGVASTTALPGSSAQKQIEQRVAGRIPWLLIDIPESRPGADVGLYYVWEGQRRQLRKDEKVAGSIQKSEVWEQYAASLLETAGKIRVFADDLLVDAVEASIGWEEGIELLVNSLEAVSAAKGDG